MFVILGLGHEIHRKLHEEAEEEKQNAIRATEEMVWQEAKAVADQDLQRVLEEAKLEQDRVVRKIKKEQGHAIKVCVLVVQKVCVLVVQNKYI